jgi:hypothetical protein
VVWQLIATEKSFITKAHCGNAAIYHRILTLENVGTKVNYHSIFITFAPGANVIKLFTKEIY